MRKTGARRGRIGGSAKARQETGFLLPPPGCIARRADVRAVSDPDFRVICRAGRRPDGLIGMWPLRGLCFDRTGHRMRGGGGFEGRPGLGTDCRGGRRLCRVERSGGECPEGTGKARRFLRRGRGGEEGERRRQTSPPTGRSPMKEAPPCGEGRSTSSWAGHGRDHSRVRGDTQGHPGPGKTGQQSMWRIRSGYHVGRDRGSLQLPQEDIRRLGEIQEPAPRGARNLPQIDESTTT